MAKKQPPKKNHTPAIVEPARKGRPHMLTPEMHDTIVKYIRAGNYATTSAELAGITGTTLFAWMQRGARGEQPFADFLESVRKARAEAKAAALGAILRAAAGNPQANIEGDWRAAAWFLERVAPDEFGRRVRVVTDDVVERAGDASTDVNKERVNLEQLSADELRTLQRLRAKARVAVAVDAEIEEDA